ncbi:MAG: glycosyltransferase family 39 protein, partial [Cyanobacteria bacterium P01_D01_bin.73]
MNEFLRGQWALVTRGDRWQRLGAIALGLVIVIGIALRFTNLDGKVVWIDEVHSFMRVGGYGKTALTKQLEQTVAATETRPAQIMPLSDLLQFQRPPDDQNPLAGLGATIKSLATDNPQHPPVYYLAARLMVSIFDSAIATLRGTAAIFGVALIPAMGWLAWVLWRSPRIAAVTMVIAAVSPFQIAYAQEAREYSLLAVMLVVTTGLLLRAMDGTRRGWWIYGGAIAIGLYTHLLMGYGIVAHGVMVLTLAGWRSPVARKFGLAIAGAVAVFVPWVVAYLVYFRGIGWIGRDLGIVGLLRRWAIGWTLPIFDLQSFYDDQLFDVAAVQDFTNLGWGWGLVVICGGLWGWCFWQLWRGSRRSAWVVTVLGLVPFLMLAIPDLVDGGQRSTV